MSATDAMMAELDSLAGGMKLEDPYRELDLVFVLDCTGSMGSYIQSATQNIELICEEIVKSEKLASPNCLRIGLIAYRDHPPQDSSYVTRNFGFSGGSDVSTIKQQLKSCYASGGGDGPEAVSAALKEMSEMDWRPNASKMAVLIADAPPHGIGEYGDGFADGSPDGSDPLHVARAMASKGITLFVAACEPALSGYLYANDHFRALAEITSGVLVPLTTASLLAHVIVGSALEQLNLESLIKEVGQTIAQRIHDGQESVDDVARELHQMLSLRNESTKQLWVENIYKDSEEARHNFQTFMNAPDLKAVKGQLKRVPGTRFTDSYLASRYHTSTRYGYGGYGAVSPPLPMRDGVLKKKPKAALGTNTSSPPRLGEGKKAFHADPSATFASASGGSPKSLGFGGFRDTRSASAMTGMGEDVDEEEDEDKNAPQDDDEEADSIFLRQAQEGTSIQFRKDPITFDQARRITLSSAWRSLAR